MKDLKMETKEQNKERIDGFFREDYCLELGPERSVESTQPQIYQQTGTTPNELPYPEMYY